MNTATSKDKLFQIAKRTIKGVLSPFGLDLVTKLPQRGCLHEWQEEANKAGMEINDYVEQDQRKPALEELNKLVFPLISKDSIICELGPGTGCYTRRLNDFIENGQLHAVDVDPAVIRFLDGYLSAKESLNLHLGSGYTLPFAEDSWMDLIFCTSTFTGIGLTYFGCYIKEFYRVLKPGQYAVFDFFDISSPAGWNVYTRNLEREKQIVAYNFYYEEIVETILTREGFAITDRHETTRGSIFFIAQKRTEDA